MIIGAGMIGSAFAHHYKDSNDILIFASGVSDSTCVDPIKFAREKRLLTDVIAKYKDVKYFIYFSTCSIYDALLTAQPYVIHKKSMEKIVFLHPRGQVIRLPQVAGLHAPPNTLLASIKNKILSDEEVLVWRSAFRNIVDLEDVLSIVDFYIRNNKFPCKDLNIANTHYYSAEQIVVTMGALLNRRVKMTFVDKGSFYRIDASHIEKILNLLGICFDSNYLERVVKRYYL